MCEERCSDRSPSRRGALQAGAAMMTAAALEPVSVLAQAAVANPPTRVLDDASIQHGPVTLLHGGLGAVGGYLARPKREGVFPAVLVIAGNRITEEYIENTCAALAVAGYVGLAPDVFHAVPVQAAPAEMEAFLAGHTDFHRHDDVFMAASFLRNQPYVSPGGMGVLGFCSGGRAALQFGARSRDVEAVVAYHPAPEQDRIDVRRLSAPVLIHQGTADRAAAPERTQALAAKLRAQGTPVELHLYDGADHGFLAYTRAVRYHPAAAQLSWERTVAFLRRRLPAAAAPAG